MASEVQNLEFIDKQQLADHRARRVWKYFTVILVAWVIFSVQFALGGYETQWVSVFGISGLSLVYLIFHRLDCSSRSRATLVTNCYLGIHSFGVFAFALTDPALEACLLAIPVGMTIAFTLLGIRAAIPWLIVGVVAEAALAGITHGFPALLPFSPVFQGFTLKAGASLIFFLCFQQFETFYSGRAADLVKLSQSLQVKTEELQSLATTDALTGLPNRFQFTNQLKNSVSDALQNDSKLALLMLDMDGFKEINDTLGHSIGDEALVEIAARLKNALDPNIAVARLGGDEFCVLLPDVSSHQQVLEICNKLHDSLCQEYQLANVVCRLGTSIGVAFCPGDSQTPEDLLTFADTAMFHAKDNHQPYAIYETELTSQLVEYCSVQEKLTKALERDEFFLVYQPQLDLQSGEIVGAEALLRWRHDGEIIPPFEFIPHLESSRRITEVTRWILETACAQIKKWNEDGLRLKIAVNISAIDLHDPNFADAVTSAIERHQIEASQLELEITEGVLIEGVEAVTEEMTRLKQTGLTISIDDFGTGYSSLAYIRQLPIDKLKIDREFVKEIPDGDDGAIASTMILLAKSLGLGLVAEGIETEEQREFFRSRDCELFQGFLASRPVSAEMLKELIYKSNQPAEAAVE